MQTESLIREGVSTPHLSVVVPVYNEQDVLPMLVERLRPVLEGLGCSYEVLTVDDGSIDATPALLERYRITWPQVRILRLRANSGHQAAISAGLAASRGAFVVTIDADLQDPPETIAEMLAAAHNDRSDVVYGVRSDRSSDSLFKRQSARAFYGLMSRVSHTPAPPSAGDFRLMSRATVAAVNRLPDHHRVLRLVVPALGFRSSTVYYRREERAAGSSKYTLGRMIRLSMDSVTGFSIVPLRLATYFGLLGSFVAAGLVIFAILAGLAGSTVPGWTSVVTAVAGFGGVQLLCLGVLGEYVGRIYMMLQGRPTYYLAYDSLVDDHEAGDRPAHSAQVSDAEIGSRSSPSTKVGEQSQASSHLGAASLGGSAQQ